MKKLLFLVVLFPFIAKAQDSLYCTPRIENGMPVKLFSMGIDYQIGGFLRPTTKSDGSTWESSMTEHSININGAGGLKTNVMLPVINRPGLTMQLGWNYQRYRILSYETSEIPEVSVPNYLNKKIADSPWTTSGVTLSIFKPWNKKLFSVFQGSVDFNGNYTKFEYPSLPHAKYSAALLMGHKPRKNLLWALGASRSYRAGELVYFPIALLSWTPTPHVGIELLLPAKASARYIFKDKSYLMVSYELEGQSYYFAKNIALHDYYPDRQFEFRKSEHRIRLNYEMPLYQFVWASFNIGYRINNQYNIDEFVDGKEVTRVWGKDASYFQENDLTGTMTLGVALMVALP